MPAYMLTNDVTVKTLRLNIPVAVGNAIWRACIEGPKYVAAYEDTEREAIKAVLNKAGK